MSAHSHKEWTYSRAILADCERISGEIIREMVELEDILDTVTLDEACAIFAPYDNRITRPNADSPACNNPAPQPDAPRQLAPDYSCRDLAPDYRDLTPDFTDVMEVPCVPAFTEHNWSGIDDFFTCYLTSLSTNSKMRAVSVSPSETEGLVSSVDRNAKRFIEKQRDLDAWLDNWLPESEFDDSDDETPRKSPSRCSQYTSSSTDITYLHDDDTTPLDVYHTRRSLEGGSETDLVTSSTDIGLSDTSSPTINGWVSAESLSPTRTRSPSTDTDWSDTEHCPKDFPCSSNNSSPRRKDNPIRSYDRSLMDAADELIKEIDNETYSGYKHSNRRKWPTQSEV